MLYYAMTWYFFTVVTYGVWVPAGLFLPGIIIGCAIGGVYADLELYILDNDINYTT